MEMPPDTRWPRIARALDGQGLQALALVPGPNLLYASGLHLHAGERLQFFLIHADGRAAALAPALEAPSWEPLGLPVFSWPDERGPAGALAELARALGLDGATIGVEYGRARYGEVEALREALPRASFRPAEPLLGALRAVKDEAELAALRASALATCKVCLAVLDAVREGAVEAELARRVLLRSIAAGGTLSFPPLVVSGPRSAGPHASPSERRLGRGDAVIVDCGVALGDYQGDITRCAAIGPASEELLHLHEVCARAAAEGRAAVRPGASAESVDLAARSVIDNAGYGANFIHRTGHGIGLEIHEPPWIVRGNTSPLLPGMVFSVEPGIYLPGLGGVRVEDLVHVTPDGCEVLTELPREIRIC